MPPCVIVDLSVVCPVPFTLHPCTYRSAHHLLIRNEITKESGKKRGEGIDQDEIDVWVWPVAGRRPGTRVDWVRNASARAAAPSFPRQEVGKEKKIDRGRNSTSLSSRLSCLVLCIVSEGCVRDRESERRRRTHSSNAIHTVGNTDTRPATQTQLGDNPTSLDALFRGGWEAYDSCDRDVTWMP